MSVISFVSSDRRTGCSMVARCFAEGFVKKNPGKTAILLCCSDDWFPGPGEDGLSFSDVAPYAEKELTDFDEILERSRVEDGLSVIFPFRPGEFRRLGTQQTEVFISRLSKMYSLVVCDLGCISAPGRMPAAALVSDRVFEVLSPGEVCIRKHEWLCGLYEKLGICFDGYILNGTDRESYYTPEEVRKRLGAPKQRFFSVRRSAFSQSAEAEGLSLLHYRDRGFAKDINSLISSICFDI